MPLDNSMDDQKSKALDAALAQIEKQFGKGSIMKMGDSQIQNDLQVVLHLRLAHFHDRALAELLFDLGQRGGEGLVLVVVHGVVEWHAGRLRSMAQHGAGGYVDADDHGIERSFDATPPNG